MQNTPAVIDHGKQFWGGSSGRWAGEQLMRALKAGKPMTPESLRTASVLRKDEWIQYDEALVMEGVIRLRGVGDLIAAGLVKTVANGMGKTVFQYEQITDMSAAQVSLDGMTRSDSERQEYILNNLPLPITHKDFYLNLRTLTASRERGEALDTTQARTAGRVVSEQVEKMLFQGTASAFGGLSVYGYTTHPSRNTMGFITNGNWAQAAKTGSDILADVLKAIGIAEGDRFYGPYGIYVDTLASTKLSDDFKANSDKTIRQRILEIDSIKFLTVADQMPANTVVLVQLTPDVVEMISGEPLQTIQWDVEGGFQINFKAFQIMVPLVRADDQGRSGVVHIS